MPGLQWRSKQGEDTNVFDIPFDGPGTFKIKLVRTGVRIFMYIGKDGAEPKEIAHTEVSFRNPVLVGLAVCSHKTDASDTVIFSDVSVEAQAPPAADLTISLTGGGAITRHAVKFQCDEHAGELGLPSGPFTVEYLNGAGNMPGRGSDWRTFVDFFERDLGFWRALRRQPLYLVGRRLARGSFVF